MDRIESVAEIADFGFADGSVLPTLKLSYWTLGTLNDRRDNAVLLSHGASGGKDWALPYCRAGGAFDPERYFIISPDMPGGGGSSRRRDDLSFPERHAIGDMSLAMIRLLDTLGIGRVHAFAGASMASLIGIDLAFRFPDRIGALALWTGGPRSDGFARGVADALRAVLAIDGSQVGFRAGAGAFLPALYGRAAVARMAVEDVDRLLDGVSAQWAKTWRADELSARYHAVGHCDLPALHGGAERLAAGIHCPLLFLQTDSDQVFDMAEVEDFVAKTPAGRLEVLDSMMGHIAPMAPPGSTEFAFFDGNTAQFLDGVGR